MVCAKTRILVCTWGVVRGVILQVHPKLPQTGSGGWTSLERYRGGDEKKKKQPKVRVLSEYGKFYTAPV